MNPSYEIKQLEKLLSLNIEDGESITYTTKSLLGPGENYGSTMLALDVTVTRKGSKTTKNYVAKLCPPSDYLKEMFNVQVTFTKEVRFYSQILPLLQDFQRENGITNVMDFFPKMCGARINLDPKSDKVDDDAVLLLTNLKCAGYESIDRMIGFDLECAEYLIKQAAVFHAVPLALKMKHKDIFEKIILNSISEKFDFKMNDEGFEQIMQSIIKILKNDANCAQLVSRVENAISHGKKCSVDRPPVNELVGSIIHNDLWVNNTMFMFQNGKPVKCVLVDFQLMEYGSPTDDLIFFLFTSVQKTVLEKYLDKLIYLYYTTFIDTLQQLSCDSSKITFQLFENELMKSAKGMQFVHILFMLMPILTKREAAKELSELKQEDIVQDVKALADDFPERVCYIISEFAKRNWI